MSEFYRSNTVRSTNLIISDASEREEFFDA